MRKVWVFTDDYGNLCRSVEVSTCWFWYPAYSKKDHAVVTSCGLYDDWGSLKGAT